jgi:hypothetical protein
MKISDVLDFNRLTPEQVFLLGEFQRNNNIQNVEIVCKTNSSIGAPMNEFTIYDAKKMYIAFDMMININTGICYIYDPANVVYTQIESYQSNITAWTESPPEFTPIATQLIPTTLSLQNMVFSRVGIILVKFIGLRITLV